MIGNECNKFQKAGTPEDPPQLFTYFSPQPATGCLSGTVHQGHLLDVAVY